LYLLKDFDVLSGYDFIQKSHAEAVANIFVGPNYIVSNENGNSFNRVVNIKFWKFK